MAFEDGWQPSWNIPPTERIVGVRERVDDNGEVTRTLGLYRWLGTGARSADGIQGGHDQLADEPVSTGIGVDV
jgi:hypothetical protein